MYSLHLILKEENTDNILEMINNISKDTLTSALERLYGKLPKDGWVSKLLEGLKDSEFFSFREFIKVFR